MADWLAPSPRPRILRVSARSRLEATYFAGSLLGTLASVSPISVPMFDATAPVPSDELLLDAMWIASATSWFSPKSDRVGDELVLTDADRLAADRTRKC